MVARIASCADAPLRVARASESHKAANSRMGAGLPLDFDEIRTREVCEGVTRCEFFSRCLASTESVMAKSRGTANQINTEAIEMPETMSIIIVRPIHSVKF